MYNKEFADIWDALPAKVATYTVSLETYGTDNEKKVGKPESISKTSDLIFPDRSAIMTVTASLKDIQVSRGGSKALGIKSKTTHFKLDTALGYKSIQDLRIVHAKDDVTPLKIRPMDTEEETKARYIKQFNIYTNKVQVQVSSLSVAKGR